VVDWTGSWLVGLAMVNISGLGLAGLTSGLGCPGLWLVGLATVGWTGYGWLDCLIVGVGLAYGWLFCLMIGWTGFWLVVLAYGWGWASL
jgi:hypothetical protein